MRNAVINKLLFVLAFLVMLARAYLYTDGMPLVHLFCLAVKMALVPVALILALRTPGRLTAVDLSLLAYALVMGICCLINRTTLLALTLLSLDIFIFWAMCRWFFARHSLFPLKVVAWGMLAFFTVNYLLMLWRPEGLFVSPTNGVLYFLLGGNYNTMGKAFVVALISDMLLMVLLPRDASPDAARSRRIYGMVLALTFILSYASVFFVGSKTSLVGVLLVTAFASLLLVPGKTLRIVSVLLLIGLYFVVQSWAVFRDYQTPSPRAEYIVEDVLHKDMTFSERTYVWAATKQLIERRPLIGYGQHDGEWYEQELHVLTTHNLVLHILLKGGWVAITAFLLLMLFTHIRLLRPDRSPAFRNARFVLLFGLWVFLFMMIFEVYSFFSMGVIITYISLLPMLSRGDLTAK